MVTPVGNAAGTEGNQNFSPNRVVTVHRMLTVVTGNGRCNERVLSSFKLFMIRTLEVLRCVIYFRLSEN